MKQHITQEQATIISAKFAEDGLYETHTCNAAIQHYLDQHAGMEKAEPVWFHKVGVHGEHRFYNQTETQPEGCTPLFTRPMLAQGVNDDCRIELTVAIHSLASNFENILGKIAKDQEAFDKARGDIAHAMKIAEKWNWNGTALCKYKGAK